MKISHDFLLHLFEDIVGPDYVSDDLAICEAYSKDGIVQRAVKFIKSKVPDIIVITDICLCEYTSHGHCGILKDG